MMKGGGEVFSRPATGMDDIPASLRGLFVTPPASPVSTPQSVSPPHAVSLLKQLFVESIELLYRDLQLACHRRSGGVLRSAVVEESNATVELSHLVACSAGDQPCELVNLIKERRSRSSESVAVGGAAIAVA